MFMLLYYLVGGIREAKRQRDGKLGDRLVDVEEYVFEHSQLQPGGKN